MNDIIALVGLPASGKSVASRTLEGMGYTIVRLGDVTDIELTRRGLAINEENERMIREEMRRLHGMDAYAKLNAERIRRCEKAVIDGLRSYEELTFFKNELGDSFRVIAIHTPKALRHRRMQTRKVRPLSKDECERRDRHELDMLGVRKTLSHATQTIVNDGDLAQFIRDVKRLL